jgi:hypothetical protein
MSPVDLASTMMQTARIYPPGMVHPFYAGERLPPDEDVPYDTKDGCVFTLERVP